MNEFRAGSRALVFFARIGAREEAICGCFYMFSVSRTDSSLGCGESADGASQIVTATGQHNVHTIADEGVEPHPAHTIVLLEDCERPLDGGAHAADQPIASLLARRQLGMMFVGPVHQAVFDSQLSQMRVPCMGVIGLIAVDG